MVFVEQCGHWKLMAMGPNLSIGPMPDRLSADRSKFERDPLPGA
jgi:hypothetical protein